MDNDGLRYGATESALRPSLPTATRSDPHTPNLLHFAEAQIHARLTNPAKQNIITSIRGSRPPVADFKSEPRPASNRNWWPASYWNAWPASSVSAHRDRAQNLGLHIVAHRHDAAPVARSPIVAIFRLVTSARNSPRAGPPTARGLTNSRTFIPSPNCLLIRRSAARDLQRRDPAGIGFVAVKLGSPLKVSRHSLQARLRCARDGKLTQNRLNSGPRVFQDREKFKVFLIIHRTPPNRRNALGAGALALRADARLVLLCHDGPR